MWLINADALMEYARNSIDRRVDCNDIARFPTIDAEPVLHGEWITKKVGARVSGFQCSECGREVKCGNDYFMKPTKRVGDIFPYCHCGAKMDGGGTDAEVEGK